MTPIGPLDPPRCRLCGGAKEIILSLDSLDDDLKTCPRCKGSGEEPPVPAAVLEEQGQQVLFSLAPLVMVLVSILLWIGIIDGAFFLAILACELVERFRMRQERRTREKGDAETERERDELAARRELAIRAYYRIQVESPSARERASWR